jgi:hypothetical protein
MQLKLIEHSSWGEEVEPTGEMAELFVDEWNGRQRMWTQRRPACKTVDYLHDRCFAAYCFTL